MTMQAHADSNARSTPAALLRAVPRVLLRLSLGVLALLLMLGALMVGAVLTIGLFAWALLRGRRLAPGAFSATFQRSQRRRSGSGGSKAAGAPGQVIDVEARVVPEHAGAHGVKQRRE
jgi:hypothetical protein